MYHPAATGEASTARRPFYRSLYFIVLLAIVAGGAVGHFWPDFGESLKPLGDAFIKLVKMIIAPVIFLTIATDTKEPPGISQDERRFIKKVPAAPVEGDAEAENLFELWRDHASKSGISEPRP